MSIPVVALWDFQNAPIPQGYIITQLRATVESSLRIHNPNFSLPKIFAYGPPLGAQAVQIKTCPQDITLVPFLRENVRCGAEQRSQQCVNWIVGNAPGEERFVRTTDRADLYAIMDMYMNTLEGKKHFLLIAGDGDYELPMIRLAAVPNAYIMLAKPENASPNLPVQAKKTWLWSSDTHRRTMIYGAGFMG